MATKFHQLSLVNLFKNCQDMFISDTLTLFSLFEENIDLNDFYPSYCVKPKFIEF